MYNQATKVLDIIDTHAAILLSCTCEERALLANGMHNHDDLLKSAVCSTPPKWHAVPKMPLDSPPQRICFRADNQSYFRCQNHVDADPCFSRVSDHWLLDPAPDFDVLLLLLCLVFFLAASGFRLVDTQIQWKSLACFDFWFFLFFRWFKKIKNKNTTLLFNFFSFFTSWKLLVMIEAKSVPVEEIKGLFGRRLVQCDGQVRYALNTCGVG